jgi:DNA-binding NarL/FixJ family response regulator
VRPATISTQQKMRFMIQRDQPRYVAVAVARGSHRHAAGDENRAHRLIHEEVRLARLFDVPIALGIALRRQALTESKEQAPRTFREAVRVLEMTEAKLEFARAHADLGRALRRVGQRVVAQLAAQGLSNREIAEQMFVSRSTVAWHVRNVYRQLQVDSRDQLKVPIDD